MEVQQMNGIIDKKFILTDEYKPLYELGRVRGPSHGPLVDPVQVSLLTLRKLILQRETTRQQSMKLFS